MKPFVHQSIMFWLYTALQYRSSMTSNFCFLASGGKIIKTSNFPVFNFCSIISSYVNSPSLMSSWLLIFFLIDSSVILGDFPSRFLKCSFHKCMHSSWLAAFIFALAVFFSLTHLLSATLFEIVYLQPSIYITKSSFQHHKKIKINYFNQSFSENLSFCLTNA